MADLEVLKEIPGYQAILKAVLKSQIQMLVEQLSSQTGEESIILTASINDGTLCHLGSSSGKMFLEDREEFKSQFLGFCLKRHHRSKTPEKDKRPGFEGPEKRARSTSHRYSPIPSTGPKSGRPTGPRRSQTSTVASPAALNQQQGFQDSSFYYDQNQPTSAKVEPLTDSGGQDSNQDIGRDDEQEEPTRVVVKSEPTDDIEITGVEMSGEGGNQSEYDSSQWAGNMSSDSMGYMAGTAMPDGAYDSSADQSYGNNNVNPTLSVGGHLVPDNWTTGDKITIKRNGKTVYPCGYCGKEFKKKCDLTRHVRLHTGERPYQCTVCGKTFVQKAHRDGHYKKHHTAKVSIVKGFDVRRYDALLNNSLNKQAALDV